MNKVIDQILQAKEGESIWIPCESLSQVQSFKIKYWRALKNYKDKVGIDPGIIISIKKKEEKNFLVLTKEASSAGAFLVTKEGEEVPLATQVVDSDRERRIRMMVKDSLSKSEILHYLIDATKAEQDLIKRLLN